MKNLKFIFVLAISIMALSCGGDDDGGSNEPTLTNALIAGTYDFTFLESTETIIENVTSGSVTTTINTEGDTFGDSNIIFTENGTYTFDFQYRTVETTTSTLVDSESSVEFDIINESQTGSYSVNDENQTLTLDGLTYDVTTFNSSTLRIEYAEDNVDGSFQEELRFSRQ